MKAPLKLAPNGTALSPAITGFTGMGVDGIGWGTGVANDKVWVTSFNGNPIFRILCALVQPGLFLADSHREAAVAASHQRVGYQAFDGTHDRVQFCRALFQNIDQFFGPFSRILSDDCFHDVLFCLFIVVGNTPAFSRDLAARITCQRKSESPLVAGQVHSVSWLSSQNPLDLAWSPALVAG